jgi:hypothetical protein
MFLLPLREKVSAKLTDEGSRKRNRRDGFEAVAAVLFFNPSPDRLRRPPSPERGKG